MEKLRRSKKGSKSNKKLLNSLSLFLAIIQNFSSKITKNYKKIASYKASRIISKTISITLLAVLIVVVAAALYMKVTGSPKIAGHQFLIVTSGSMEPTLQTGSVIAMKDVQDKSALKPGDIITYKSLDDPNQLITHRILEVEPINDVRVKYITQGDNNDSKDLAPIPDINVVGKYAGIHIPIIGYIFSFINSKMGAVLFMIIPGILIIGWQLMNIWKLISNLEKKQEEQTEASK